MKRYSRVWLLSLVFLFLALPAQAARQFTLTQTSPTAPVQFDMGTTQTVTFSATNTSNGGNAGERIYEMRFRLSSGTTFSSSTVAPAGWTRTVSGTTLTFTATDWTTAIPAGSSVSFNVAMVMRSTTADATESLRDGRASFTTDTNFGNGISRSGRVTTNNPGSWTLMSLAITSFQTVDATTGLPISTIVAGQSFKLEMTVRNNSSATQTSIVSSPNPPTATKTGTVTQTLTTTVYSPSPLTLAAGASGTITFTYSTLATNNGTITFSAYARNNSSSATSRTAVSNLLNVSGGSFIANLTVSTPSLPPCAYFGQTITVKMDLNNSYAYGITGITPTLSPTVAGIVTLTSGPTPATASMGAATTTAGVFQWTYQVTGGNGGDTLAFTGSASGTASAPGSGTKTTPTATSASVKRGGFLPMVSPSDTNADSTNEEVTIDITNKGCGANVKTVSIQIPGGWTYGGDGYSEFPADWTLAGGGPAVFSAGTQIPLDGSGSFSLVLDTPTATGSYFFTLTITDSLNVSVTVTTSNAITVNPFNSGSPNLNSTVPGAWREEFR